MASATTDRRLGLTSDKGIKAPVTVATTANITLSGEQTVDGVAVKAINAAGVPDRVLVKNQTSSVDNGIYDVSTAAWTRSYDSNGSQDLVTGTGFYIVSGNTYTGQFWSVSTTGTITPGSTAINFAQSLSLSAQTVLTNLAANGGDALSGHIDTGTGAIATTVQSKLREVVHAVSDYGAVADFGVTSAATNNTKIQNALNSFGSNGGTVVIKKGVAWNYATITHPNEVVIHDFSGYDWVNSQWTGQVKIITATASPSTKNANEFQVISPYHPGIVISNTSGGSNKTTSLVFDQSGVRDWQFAADAGASTGRLLGYSYYGTYAGTSYPSGTHIFTIDPNEGNWGFNSNAVSGIDWYWQSYRAGTSTAKYVNLTAQGWERQYANATNGLLLREQISGADGSYNVLINGNTFNQLSANGECFGSKFKVISKSGNYSLNTTTSSTSDVNTSSTNSSAGGVTFTLPAATPGLVYEFAVTVGGITVTPATGEKFRAKAANASYASTTLGSVILVKCYVAGIWDVPILMTGWA